MNLEKVWILDRNIERHIFESIRSFTTFTLDKQTFVQIFDQSAQYKFQFEGSKANVQTNSNSHDFGFCMIRLNWVSSNIAECHFGFY